VIYLVQNCHPNPQEEIDMAVDLSCYVSQNKFDVDNCLEKLSQYHQDLFPEKFLLSNTREADAIHKEIALEYGLHAQSFFMVSLNDKNAARRVLYVVKILKCALGDGNIIILHGNETKV
jgi:hypothetical protein